MTVAVLSAAQAGLATALLCEAFAEYPVMRYVLGSAGDYGKRLQTLIGFFVAARVLREDLILGVFDSSQLAAVAPPWLGRARALRSIRSGRRPVCHCRPPSPSQHDRGAAIEGWCRIRPHSAGLRSSIGCRSSAIGRRLAQHGDLGESFPVRTLRVSTVGLRQGEPRARDVGVLSTKH